MSDKLTRYLSGLRGKKTAVLGMGISNIPLIRMLLDAGLSVEIRDKKPAAKLDESLIDEFKKKGAGFNFGEGYLKSLNSFDVVFRSPGISPLTPELVEAETLGVGITSEMRLFFDVCPCPIIGVTGSDGKSTTTTIIYELLKAQGIKCHIGGNIGMPLLNRADYMDSSEYVVLELSSFQLSDMEKSPRIAVITNVAPNHLDVHKSMDEYIEAKKNIYRHQTKGGRVVLNLDNEITRDMAKEAGGRAVVFSRRERPEKGFAALGGVIYKVKNNSLTGIIKVSDIKLPGLHNVENYLAAIAATDGLVETSNIRNVARSFGGVEHRLEFVRGFRGVSYYNDSIASSPTRTIAGLNSFDKKVILIAGGRDKKIPFDTLADEINIHVKSLILLGETAETIGKAVRQSKNYCPDALDIHMCATLDDAVIKASGIAKPGDTVLLSPACTSFDMFNNFEERGRRFKEAVLALK